jgi:integrase
MPRKTFKKLITSSELIEKIDIENIKLMNRFLKEKSTRSSERTIIVYRSNLEIFFCWNVVNNSNKFFVDIKKLEFADFFSYAVEELKWGSSRLNNLRSVLSSFSAFIEKFYDEIYPSFRNVILRVVESTPKEFRREKTILLDEQIEDLLQHLSSTDKQKACWLALAVCSGARFSELLRFDVDIINEERMAFGDLFLETTKQIKTKGRGRSGKLLYKYILRDKFLPHYKEWLVERQSILESQKKSHNSLFIRKDGEPITESGVRSWVADFEDYLKVPFYTHSLRHYLTTLLARKNIPHPLIKEIFGWENIGMVGVYDDSTAKDRVWTELENLKGI